MFASFAHEARRRKVFRFCLELQHQKMEQMRRRRAEFFSKSKPGPSEPKSGPPQAQARAPPQSNAHEQIVLCQAQAQARAPPHQMLMNKLFLAKPKPKPKPGPPPANCS